MNFIFRLLSGGTAIVEANNKAKAIELMSSIYGKNEFELAS